MGKKTRQNAIRVTSELFELGRMMMSTRGADNFSEYVRGLILLDAAHCSPELVIGHDLPAWITRDKRFEIANSDHRKRRSDDGPPTRKEPV
jgi:hypothetical protein